MHHVALRWVALAIVALSCACGPRNGPVPSATTPTGPSSPWSARLVQSGGLLGISLEVRITSGGEVVAVDRRSGRSSTTELTPAQLGEIERLYSAAAAASYSQESSVCSDCFVYELTLTSGEGNRTVRLDDSSLPGTAAEPLIAYLIRLRDRALAAP